MDRMSEGINRGEGHVARYDLGVLFVHGIGDQPRGSTLIEFATPLVDWLAGHLARQQGSVEVVDTMLAPGDENVPAHSELMLAVGDVRRRWLMSETWWAKSFPAPPFSEMVRWGLGAAPWAFGSHFGVALRRLSGNRPRSWTALGWWLVRMVSAVLSVVGGLLLSLGILALLIVTLLVAVIPISTVRQAVARFQLRLAATLGDSYVLVTRPLEAAAITGRLRRDLRWMEAVGCDRLAIVAHSQGAAVSCKALEREQPPKLRLLVTFGSGLRKLEELDWLRRKPTFRRSAALALAGLVAAGLGIGALPFSIDQMRVDVGSAGSVITLAILAVLGVILLVAGIRDLVVTGEVESLRRLDEWRALFEGRGLAWLDLYASADPVPNGGLGDERRRPNPEALVKSVEVTNTNSMVRDHTGYWLNRDEFVSRLGGALLRADDSLSDLAFDDDALSSIGAFRSWRVRLLRFARSLAIISVIGLLIRYSADWVAVVGSITHRMAAGLGGLVGMQVDTGPVPPPPVWWRTLGWGAGVAAVYLVSRWAWQRWNDREAEALLEGRPVEGDPDTLVAVFVWVQAIVIGLALAGDEAADWVIALSLFSGIILWVVYYIRKPSLAPEVASALAAETSKEESTAVRAASLLRRVFSAVVYVGAMGLFAVAIVRGTQSLLHRVAPDRDAGILLSGLAALAGIGVVSMLISVLVVSLRQIRSWRRARAADKT